MFIIFNFIKVLSELMFNIFGQYHLIPLSSMTNLLSLFSVCFESCCLLIFLKLTLMNFCLNFYYLQHQQYTLISFYTIYVLNYFYLYDCGQLNHMIFAPIWYLKFSKLFF